MRILFLVPGLLALTACKGDKDGPGGGGTDPGDATYSLKLSLGAPSTEAGNAVGYTLTLESSEGGSEPVSGRLADALESGLSWDDSSLTPTVAGSHPLTATAEVDGETYTATATLSVDPGPAVDLDLSLSATSFAAGESLDYSLSATDAYGNAVDTSGALVEPSDDAVTVGGGVVTGTLPGSYHLEASLDAASDTEYFVIYTAFPASVTLELSDVELEVGDSSRATVTVLDAYGNPTDDPYTLGVTGDGLAVISGDNITFESEGLFTVDVVVDGTDLTDEVGPLLVDSSGPDIDLSSPERGGWSDGLTGTVAGTVTDEWSGVDSVTVNGEEVSLNVDGSFSMETDWEFGLNILETEAVDGDGNVSNDTRATLAGDFLSYGSSVSGGMLARINEGAGGLDELEALGEGLVSATDLDDLIPSPVYSYEDESCYSIPWVGTFCFTWYGVTLYVKNPTIGSTDLDLDPLSTGQIKATFTVYNPALDWSANATVAEVDFSGSGDVTATSMTATLLLTPKVSGGKLSVSVDSVSVSTSGFDFDMDSWLYDALDYVGLADDVDDWIRGYMEDAIEDAVYGELPDLLEDTFQDLELSYSFPLSGRNYTLKAKPDGVSVDATGLTLSLGTSFTTDSWVGSRKGLGSLYYGYGRPSFSGGSGTTMAMSDDFLNQVFYALWGGGLLNLEVTDEDLGLDPADLALVLPDLTDLTVTVEPLLPPVAVPGTGSELLDLQVGDMLLTIYNGPAEPGYEYIQVYVSAIAGLDVTVSSDATLVAALGDAALYFDVVYPESNSVAASSVETLLDTLVPLLLPELTGALAEIEIPSFEGFGLTSVSVGLDGAEDGYVTLGGTLKAD